MSNDDRLQFIIDEWRQIRSRLDLVLEQQATTRVENVKSIKSDIDRIVDQLTKIKINLHLIESKVKYSENNLSEILQSIELLDMSDKPEVIQHLLIFVANDEKSLRQAISHLSQSELAKLRKAINKEKAINEG